MVPKPVRLGARIRLGTLGLTTLLVKLKILWSGPMRRIVSIWLPDWPIERLIRQCKKNAEYDAKAAKLIHLAQALPFVLVAQTAHGLAITATNARARHEGIRVHMALADARAILPSLQTAPAREAEDREGLERLARWCGRYGPARNVDGASRIWIDVTGTAPLFAIGAAQEDVAIAHLADIATGSCVGDGARQSYEERLMLADMTRRLRQFGLSPMIALADTLGAAHALAGYGIKTGKSSVIAPLNTGREALAGLPVEGLRLDASAVLLLKRLGLRRIGQLYDIPRQSLERRFCNAASRSRSAGGSGPGRTAKTKSIEISQAVLWRLDQAFGLIGEPRAPLVEPACFTVRRDYPDVLISSEALVNEIERLIGELTHQLAAAGKGARRLFLTVYRADGTHSQIVIGTSFPSRDPAHLMRLIKEKIETLDAGFGVDVLLLSALEVEPLNDEQSILAAVASPSGWPASFGVPSSSDLVAGALAKGRARSDYNGPEGIAPLLDTLTNRIGNSRIFSLKLLASHIPERRQIQHSASYGLSPDAGQGEAEYEIRAADRFSQSYSFTQPDLSLRPCLLLSRPEPVLVIATLDDGPPAQFVWRCMTRRIVKAAGPERISAEWWRHLPGSVEDSHEAYVEVRDQSIGADGPPSNQVAQSDFMSLSDGTLRDYYHVQDQQGGRYWLFRYWSSQAECAQVSRAKLPRWYVHGVFA